ncbi:MAG: hypothetical protein RIR96_625 [Bacteroidota bacterium]
MRLFLFIAFIMILTGSFAQQRCGTAEYLQSVSQVTTGANQNTYARDTVTNEILTVPVVIHVLYNQSSENISQAQILSQLKVLNDDFRRMNADASITPSAFRNDAADCRIMFCLAQLDPRGRTTNGIIRKQTSKTAFALNDGMKFTASGGDDAWDSKKYLNIWVCNLQGTALGYSTIPGSSPDRDGVVIRFDAFGTTGTLRPTYNKGRTATHEIGHWLGLKHIWGEQTCGDDGIGDTPQQESYNSHCLNFPSMSACSPDNRGDMFMNFMDYTPDACMNIFTHGQKTKMRSMFAVNGPRNSFMNSFVCDSTMGGGATVPSTDTATASPVQTVPVNSITVYPNPIQNQFNIKADDINQIAGKKITVFNASGMKLISIQAETANLSINTSTWRPGLYLLQIGEGKDRVIKKLIKY